MRKIFLIQHCQSEHHINNMTGGWTDTPLTEFGRTQSGKIAIKLRELIDEGYSLYSSDLLRAKQTAEIIGRYLNLGIIEDKGLREINTGIAAGKTKEWARANRNPKLAEGFDLDYQEFSEGETWREFYIRVCNCVEKICEKEKGNLIIVTHGCTLSYIVAWWLKINTQILPNIHIKAEPGSITVLEVNNYKQNSLCLLNGTSHLK